MKLSKIKMFIGLILSLPVSVPLVFIDRLVDFLYWIEKPLEIVADKYGTFLRKILKIK